MKIGLCTTDFERRGMDALFARIEEMGFDSVQFSFDSVTESGFEADAHIEIPAIIDARFPERVAACARKHHLSLDAVNGTFNMAHPDADVRNEGVRRFDGFCRAVRDMGTGIVTLCSGTRSREGLWRFSVDNETEAAWGDMLSSMRAVADIADRYSLTLAIETEASNIIDTPEKARRIMDEVGSPRLKMVMDCANLFHAGEAHADNSRAVIDHAFDVFGDAVVLAHGKDIHEGAGIDFCATGEGIVDFRCMLGRLKALGYRGPMMLHGIYDEAKMPACLDLMRGLAKEIDI